MTDAERIEELLGEMADTKEDLDAARNDYQVIYKEWRKEYWQRIRAERNLANALVAVNGVVNGNPECHHENLEIVDGRIFCQNPDCDAVSDGVVFAYWEQVTEREWALVVSDNVYSRHSQFRVWLIRGGRYVIMVHQPGRFRRGENPAYVKLWSEPFVQLEDAMWVAERLHNALVKPRSSHDAIE